jgi:NAD(P)H-dependent FMN reductase
MNVQANMQSSINILGVAGSMRDGSYSSKGLKIALKAAKMRGAEVQILHLNKTILPLFNPSAPRSEDMREAGRHVARADAFILASPDYHGSVSGALKNFLDCFYEEFSGKLFSYIVASHEKGLTVMDQMRTAVRQCSGWSLPYGVSVNGEQDFVEGHIVNRELSERLEMMSRDLVMYGRLLRTQFAHDLELDEPHSFAARYRA